MKRKAWVGFIAGWVVLAAGCGEELATATPVDTVEPSPTAVQPTATHSPMPADTPAPANTPRPMATPTPTPFPTLTPTPTRVPTTPTPSELRIREFGWYSNEETDSDVKKDLIRVLLRMSSEYPLVFEKVAQKPWLDPEDVPETLESVLEVVEGISLITGLTEDEAAGLKVLDMPFLNDIEGEETELLDHLWEMVGGRENSYNTFLDHVIANGGLIGSETRVDVQYAYMVAQDSAGMNRVFRGELPDSDDSSILGKMITLYQRYPDAYFAASENFTVPRWNRRFVDKVIDLAKINEQSAERLAQMPFNAIPGGLGHAAWTFVTRIAQGDPSAAETLLEEYGMQGGADHSTLALLVMDAAFVFVPGIVERVRTFDWVRDGVEGPRFREEDWGRLADSEDEGDTLERILWEAHLGETWINNLLEKDWITDDLTSDEGKAVDWLAQFSDDAAGMLIEMQFLDDVDRDDSQLLILINNYLGDIREVSEFSLSDVLNDNRIGGEITDANRHLVESVIDDVLERSGL